MDERQIEQQKIELLLANLSLENAVIDRLEGYFYRTVNYRYSRQPLSTKGAEITGGRYNFRPPQGESFPCLYCADRDITASTEKFYNLKTNNAPLPPHTIVSILVRLERVLNLSSSDRCQVAGVDWHELNQPWEYHQDILKIAAYPQRIGQLAYDSQNETLRDRGDIEGILFTSTKLANTLNLVIFPQRVRMPSIVELYDPQNELK